MNNQRRKEIDRILGMLEDAKYELDCILDEEQECYDNMPENLQYSERGELAEEAISNIEQALDCIDEAIEYAETAKG